MTDKIKISKRKMGVGVIMLIVVVIFGVYLFYYIENNKEIKINDYKLEVYNSLVCQFSCPMEEARFQNETRLLPETTCIEKCTENLKLNYLKNDSYIKEQLLGDNLFKDIDGAIIECRGINMDAAGSVNYSSYYNCNLEKLYAMRDKYGYLG